MLIQTIEKAILWLKYIKAWLIFELEKAWKDISFLSEEEKQKLLKELDKYNNLLYWESFLKQPRYLKRVYFKVLAAYEDNIQNIKLSSKEKASIEKFLKELQNYLSKNLKNLSKNKIYKQLETQIWPGTNKKDILNKELSPEQAKKIFELVFQIFSKIYWFDFNYEVKVENRNTVTINFDKLLLQKQNYTVYHIIKLIAHEVEKHATKYKNM